MTDYRKVCGYFNTMLFFLKFYFEWPCKAQQACVYQPMCGNSSHNGAGKAMDIFRLAEVTSEKSETRKG